MSPKKRSLGLRTRENKAVFMDRDGVIIKEVNYLSRVEDMTVIPGVADAIAKLREAGFKAIIISNQSAVARGLLSLSGLKEITRVLRADLLKQNLAAKLDAVYYCPHHPDFDKSCACRKPEIGLILKAQKKFNIDLKSSYFIGDSSVDIFAARRAGCIPLLVRTGKAGKDGLYHEKPQKTFKSFPEAVSWVLRQ
jgi:D-glycero-D-manno-heptose 1,7-bisphosphate phosphatase